MFSNIILQSFPSDCYLIKGEQCFSSFVWVFVTEIHFIRLYLLFISISIAALCIFIYSRVENDNGWRYFSHIIHGQSYISHYTTPIRVVAREQIKWNYCTLFIQIFIIGFLHMHTIRTHISLKCRFDMLCIDILAHIHHAVCYWTYRKTWYIRKSFATIKSELVCMIMAWSFACMLGQFRTIVFASWGKYIFNLQWCDMCGYYYTNFIRQWKAEH